MGAIMNFKRIRQVIFYWALTACLIPTITWAQERGPLSPFEEPLVSEQELIQRKAWDQKSKAALQKEYEDLKKDMGLMQKRLEQLSGKTRLNQDQYREKDILDELSYIRQREVDILGRLIEQKSDLAPDFSLPSTWDRDISLQEFRDQKHLLLAFYLFDFSPT